MQRLQRQAKKALRHKELRDQIHELDLSIGSHEYMALGESIGETPRRIGRGEPPNLKSPAAARASLETDLESTRLAMVEAEKLIEQAGASRLEVPRVHPAG